MTAVEAEKTDIVVIGAGISGLAAAKCLRESGFDVVVLERTDEVGGLWTFREKSSYGVMRFTHINVSKINYCFSDFPFPDDVPDFPHNAHMADYIKNYTKHFKLYDVIKFNRQVDTVKQKDDGWHVTAHTVELDEDGKYQPKEKEEYACRFVVVASGHHVTTTWPNFDGQDTFTGSKIHAVDYKDCVTNDLVDKQVVVVGIGNSAVDAAVNVAAVGRRKPVYLSTRSGAWVVPNYIFGVPVDHYACRFFLNLPWRVGTFVLEKVIALVSGHPNKWGLKPKMHALQTQPTVSPVLVSHIQRGDIKIKPNILRIEGSTVTFTDDSQVEADSLVFCTGYKMSLPFIEPQVMEKVLDPKTNQISLYKNVFSPEVGRGLAFVGFVQPASGGILSMSEMQARWFAELCKESVSLPSKADMEADIKKEQEASSGRYYRSARHTIQKDPILYCDEIAGFIGAKPQVTKFPTLAWRLWFGTNGCAQYRLQGPHPWDRAEEVVRSIPVTSFIHYGIITVVLNLIFWFLMLLHGLCDFFDLSDRWDPLEWLGLD